MDLVLLDWTRMGGTYCLAGVVVQAGQLFVVRPLPATGKASPVRKFGWPANRFVGHSRWEWFEMVGAESASPQPPHLEDTWVTDLRPRRRLATASQRQAILQATLTPNRQDLFGVPLQTTRTSFFLQPGTGARSLAGITVAAEHIHFTVSERTGASEPDYRVRLAVPGLENRFLPVKDHFLLSAAESRATTPTEVVHLLNQAIEQMAPTVVVRLGLSRPHQATATAPNVCWLMADGFFSLNDPKW